MSEIRVLCGSRGIRGGPYYAAMAGYRNVGGLTREDRRTLDRLATSDLRLAWLTQKYGAEAVARVGLADYDLGVR